MLYINHLNAKICCSVLVDSCLSVIVRKFFSMFFVTNYDMGFKNIGEYRIVSSAEGDVQLVYNDNMYMFGSIYESLMFISDGFLNGNMVEGRFHGAVCAKPNGKALVLVGESMAGKTSLNMFLCKNGYTYLSDDIVAINESKKIISVPIPIKVRHGIMYDDPFYSQYVIYSNNDYKVLISLSEDTTVNEYDIETIIFLHRGQTLRTERKYSSELMVSLLSNLAQVRDINKQIYFTSNLIKGIKGVDLYYNSLDQELLKIISDLSNEEV